MPAVVNEELFKASDGFNIFIRRWEPQDGNMKALIHIHHGLSEHGLRYAGFAEKAVEQGYGVVAHDARGHGRTAKSEGSPGLGHVKCGPEGATSRWARDFAEILNASQSARPVPIILLGHSFGTIIVRMVVSGLGLAPQQRVPPIAGVLLSAPPARMLGPVGVVFRGLIGALQMVQGKDAVSKVPGKLSFDQFQAKTLAANKPSGAVSGWEWLNRDKAEVQKYIDDELCGQDLALGFWSAAIPSLISMKDPATYKSMADDLPIAVFQGDQDFCAIDDLGVLAAQTLQLALQKAGKATPKLVVYGGARHEILLEENSAEVIDDMLAFANKCLAGGVEPRRSKL